MTLKWTATVWCSLEGMAVNDSCEVWSETVQLSGICRHFNFLMLLEPYVRNAAWCIVTAATVNLPALIVLSCDFYCRTRLMLFNELAQIFSDDDNQRMSREVLNRVCSCISYWLLSLASRALQMNLSGCPQTLFVINDNNMVWLALLGKTLDIVSLIEMHSLLSARRYGQLKLCSNKIYLMYNWELSKFLPQKLRNGFTASDELWHAHSVTPTD